MISRKLDSQLSHLAKLANCTYTKYADDITFSFTCRQKFLPRSIVETEDDAVILGGELVRIIEENGFKINYSKVRIRYKSQRMEVTGLTVNEFVNVPRKYIREISSILHAWDKYGYSAAEDHYNNKYNKLHKASGEQKSLVAVVKGKLSFLVSVRTSRDEIFIKLAKKFNSFPEVDDQNKFSIFEQSDPEKNALDSLWVFETLYDHSEKGCIAAQGTGFSLTDLGVITCAHVVSEGKEVLENIEIYKYDNTSSKFSVTVTHIDYHRDIAVCQINESKTDIPPESIAQSDTNIKQKQTVTLLGFPAYNNGQTPTIIGTNISTLYPQSGISKFEIANQIREGNSGGPIINDQGEVIGVALEGAQKDSGNNGCLLISEIIKSLESK